MTSERESENDYRQYGVMLGNPDCSVPIRLHCHTLDPMNRQVSSPLWVRMSPASGKWAIGSEAISSERRAVPVPTVSGTAQLTMGNLARDTAQTEL
jgi:hypothetical protein